MTAAWGGDIDLVSGEAGEAEAGPEVVVPEAAMLEWAAGCLRRAGAGEGPAAAQAALLMAADRRGHFSHGFNRLGVYCRDIQSGACLPGAQPTIVRETAAAALVEGGAGLGAVIGEFSMALAIRKAGEAGVGWVTARNSNHFGIAGHYSAMAERAGMVGLAFTNGTPWVAATRSRGQRLLSTNPIAFSAPGQAGDGLCLDMATSAVAAGKIEVAAVRGEAIPVGWAVDGKGRDTRDPREALREGAGLPLGGREETSGYKGFGLALMVEVLCGVMADGAWGPGVRAWGATDGSPGGLSHCFLALDPAVCGAGFPGRVDELLGAVRGLEPADPAQPVLAPGDKERGAEEEVRARGGVSYSG
jgi:LDH2 family malate/lactate/ureidoglycolate dehydrogenase